MKYVPSLLRTQRRTWGFSQREMADLLGFESSAEISRIEHGKRTPGLETALACSTLFGVSLHELFPQLAATIETTLKGRASRLRERLLQTTTLSGVPKRA